MNAERTRDRRALRRQRSNAHTRIRQLLADPQPLIVGYDESAWARVFDDHAHDPEDADWLRIFAEHLEVHARQIERNLAAWRERAASPGRP